MSNITWCYLKSNLEKSVCSCTPWNIICAIENYSILLCDCNFLLYVHYIVNALLCLPIATRYMKIHYNNAEEKKIHTCRIRQNSQSIHFLLAVNYKKFTTSAKNLNCLCLPLLVSQKLLNRFKTSDCLTHNLTIICV